MDQIRIGRFTSSEVYRLMTRAKNGSDFGAPALSYIKEKVNERLLGLSIDLETTSRSLSWGKAIEGYVCDTYLGPEYSVTSQESLLHSNGLLAGTPDVITDHLVGEIKCPLTRASLCSLVEIIESGSTEVFKSQNPQYYYQIVSNAELTNKKEAELIIFMPYEDEVQAIVEYAELIDDFQLQRDIQWLVHEDIERIPHLLTGGYFKNFYKFKFEVPEKDKESLIKSVEAAEAYIHDNYMKA